MIPAAHSPLFRSVFGTYVGSLLARRFHALWVRGTIPADEPLLLAMQHVSWWDPLVLFHLSRKYFPEGGTYFAMMNEANLRKYRFFRWIGAFGVNLEDREERGASVRYAAEQLSAPRARVLVYPQGRQRPMEVRPLGCKPGALWIAAKANARIVPIAVRYEFCEDEHPDAFVSVGAPFSVAPDEQSEAPLESALTTLADQLREDVHRARLQDFSRVIRGAGNRDPRPAYETR